ncbi:MAG: glucokinase [Caulobacter sp.]|nr:glucokinase [Caulobacter sp.]
MTPPASPAGLVADIGGTNVRFARTLPGPDGAPTLVDERVFRGDDHPDLESCLALYIDGLGGDRPTRAVFGVACAVDGDAIRLTNRDWLISVEALKRRFGFERLDLLNDFAAVAHAVPALRDKDRRPLPGPAWPDATPDRVSVVGPGTGLGVAVLVDGEHVIASEGGHAAFAPHDAEEAEILRLLLRRLPRVSKETLLSGRGLETLHGAMAERDGRPVAPITAARIVEQASADRLAHRTLERFALLLASALGDLALIHGARAVAVAGGIPPRIAPWLDTAAFRDRFEDRGPASALLRSVPVALIAHPQPGLLGAARRLDLRFNRN